MTRGQPRVILKPDRQRSLLRRHPWVFSGAVARVEGQAGPGDTVRVCAHDGAELALGAYSPRSQIRVRAWSFAPDEPVDAAFFRRRLASAVAARAALLADGGTTACRLVNAESDGLPGVVLDRYGPQLVCQLTSTGAERWREVIAAALLELLPACDGVYERSDVGERRKEGLAPRAGVVLGPEPPELLLVREAGLEFWVDVRRGHKTGFYLDQRESRLRLAAGAAGAELLNCFAYTGGFAVHALAAGAARVTNLDSSGPALELAARNLSQNGLQGPRSEAVEGDAFALLRAMGQQGRRFDQVVLDPPKFVDSRDNLQRGTRGYKDINLQAMRLLRPGGLLYTFSCSGLVPADLLQKVVAGAALDSGREVQLIGWLGAAADHPVALAFPEGAYLKGLLCRVL